MSNFTPTSSIRPIGQGAKLVAAIAEAREKHPGDLEAQAVYVRQAMARDVRTPQGKQEGSRCNRQR